MVVCLLVLIQIPRFDLIKAFNLICFFLLLNVEFKYILNKKKIVIIAMFWCNNVGAYMLLIFSVFVIVKNYK